MAKKKAATKAVAPRRPVLAEKKLPKSDMLACRLLDKLRATMASLVVEALSLGQTVEPEDLEQARREVAGLKLTDGDSVVLHEAAQLLEAGHAV